MVISIVLYVTDKGEHTAPYKINNSVYIKTSKMINYIVAILYSLCSHMPTCAWACAHMHACMHTRTHACTHTLGNILQWPYWSHSCWPLSSWGDRVCLMGPKISQTNWLHSGHYRGVIYTCEIVLAGHRVLYTLSICTLLCALRLWISYTCRFCSFVIHVWHPQFPLNRIKRYVTWWIRNMTYII